MANTFKTLSWDETTGKADFYCQGVCVLNLTLDSYDEASVIYGALTGVYNQGVHDGLVSAGEAIARLYSEV